MSGEWETPYREHAEAIVAKTLEDLDISWLRSAIDIVLTDKASKNARALKIDDRYTIELNLGAVFVSEDMFSRLLSHKKVWPEMGQALMERDERLLEDFASDADTIFKAMVPLEILSENENYSRPQPKCPTRGAYAGWMNRLFWDYLVLHELGHIVHGHLRYLRDAELRVAKVEPLTYHAFEMDADAFALTYTLRLAQSPDVHRKLSREGTPSVLRYLAAIDVFRATYFSFNWQSGGGALEREVSSAKHPTPRIRQGFAFVGMVNYLRPPRPQDTIRHFYEEARRMEGFYSLLIGRPSSQQVHHSVIFDPYALEIMAEGKRLHLGLGAFAFVPLPTPVDFDGRRAW